MNYLDFIILIPLVWGAWKGFQRGLVFEIAMLIGLILGIYLAFKFSSLVETLIAEYFNGSSILPYVSFFLIFISVIILMVMLAKLLEAVLKITALNPFNKIAGALFGCIKFALVLSIILSLLRPVNAKTELISIKTRSESLLYDPVISVGGYLFPAIQDVKTEFSKRVSVK